jgi:CheY-like chemotaxis protein
MRRQRCDGPAIDTLAGNTGEFQIDDVGARRLVGWRNEHLPGVLRLRLGARKGKRIDLVEEQYARSAVPCLLENGSEVALALANEHVQYIGDANRDELGPALGGDRPGQHRLATPRRTVEHDAAAGALPEFCKQARPQKRLDDLQTHGAFEIFESGDIVEPDSLNKPSRPGSIRPCALAGDLTGRTVSVIAVTHFQTKLWYPERLRAPRPCGRGVVIQTPESVPSRQSVDYPLGLRSVARSKVSKPMRVLVADRDATLLAALASTFGGHLEIVTATGRDRCLELLRQRKFDLVVASDQLTDYTGLELLSEVATDSPDTLRVFAATASRLKQLESRLGFFGLFRTLSYPIDARKLLPTLALARSHLQAQALAPVKAAPVPITASPRPAAAKDPATRGVKPKGPPPRTAAVPSEAQRAAFQRALARRNAAKAQAATNTREHQPQTRINGPARPLNKSSSAGSLSELARMAMAPGAMRNPRATEPRPKRAVFYVGTGLAAALAVAGLSFELLGANGFFARSHGPVAGERPLFGPPDPAPFVARREVIPSSPFEVQQAQPTSESPEPAAASAPQPEPVNPDTAPPDPPPPPALERPGPMEPPSMPSMMPSWSGSEE